MFVRAFALPHPKMASLMDGEVAKQLYGDLEKAARSAIPPKKLTHMLVICAVSGALFASPADRWGAGD